MNVTKNVSSIVSPGDKQIITIVVHDKKSGTAITGASVLGKISSPTGPFKNVKEITDNTGKASYSWIVSDADAIGYACKICGRTFSTPVALAAHIESESERLEAEQPEIF